MSNFDWQTEEEMDWGAPDPPSNKEPKRSKAIPRRRLLLLAAGLLLLLGLGTILFFQTQRRLTEAESLVTEELLTSVDLVREASQNNDADLLNALLSGRDPQWSDNIFNLGDSARLYARPDFGLTLDASEAEPTISLSLDLLAAEVVQPQTYLTQTGESVVLLQTAVYRRGELRWLLAPPEADFWGDINTLPGSRHTLIYPDRDTAEAVLLQEAFDAALTQLCETAAVIQCPLGFIVRLTTDPSVLQREPWLTPGNQLVLPAPTLFGKPQSESDTSPFVQSYVNRLLTAVLADAVGYQCCDQRALFDVILNAQFAELELQPYPLSAADLQAIVNETSLVTVREQLNLGWQAEQLSNEESALFAAIISVAQSAAPNSSPIEKFGRLSQLPTPQVWLQQVSPNFEARWQQIRRESGQLPAPAIQNVQFTCGQALYEFDVATRQVATLLLGINGARRPLWPLPNGILLQGTFAHTLQNQWQIAEFSDQEAEIIFSRDLDNNEMRSYRGTVDPSGRTLVVQIATTNVANNSIVNQFGTLDIASCRDDCELNLLFGEPIWSPSGERMFILPPEVTAVPRQTLIILDRIDPTTFAQTVRTNGDQLLDAFWITEQIIALFERTPAGTQLVLRGLTGTQSVPLLTDVEMSNLIDNLLLPGEIQVEAITVGGENNGYLLINLNNRHLILHQREQGISTSLGRFDDLFLPQNGRSPNGRYLTFLTPSTLGILDLLSFDQQGFPLGNYARIGSLIDWDDSGEWLLLTTETNIIMHHLPSNQTDFFPHGQSACLGSAWVKAK